MEIARISVWLNSLARATDVLTGVPKVGAEDGQPVTSGALWFRLNSAIFTESNVIPGRPSGYPSWIREFESHHPLSLKALAIRGSGQIHWIATARRA